MFCINSVSRETRKRLEIYEKMLVEWNKTHNLVDKKTITDAGLRHFSDSMQLFDVVNKEKTLLDVGSGAGFPGLVIAIMGHEKVTLIDSIQKKCTFMKNVAIETGTKVDIICDRVENLQHNYYQFSSRAFAPLTTLLEVMNKNGQNGNEEGFFLKGKKWRDELKQAINDGWLFEYDCFVSSTNNDSVILKIKELRNEKC